jgi:two-component system, cell cycle response regulator DivK
MATLVLVDDHDSQREIYEQALSTAGFVVHQAASGEQANELTHRLRPDVVVLDLAMPKLDGCEVCRRLKAHPATRGIPIIVVTAHIAPGIRESAERAGCDAYLTKPCLPEKLIAAVRDHLKREVA